MSDSATFAVDPRGGTTRLVFSGRLDSASVGSLWTRVVAAARGVPRGAEMVIDLTEVPAIDTTGAALLLAAEAAHGGSTMDGARDHVRALIARTREAPAPDPVALSPVAGDDWIRRGWMAALAGIAFLGEALIASIRAPTRPRLFRVSDLMRHADQAGVRSVPLLLMLGYLIGLILAFQALIPLQQYGADLFVANVVAISLTRELGPLLAAVILAGRTGSAYAAELGTMKVNEELAALETMGLDAMTLLVLPRVAACALVMPAMALIMELAGMAGMMTVMGVFGFAPPVVLAQVRIAAKLRDLVGGLVKAVVFGAVIAGVGCRAGLGTGVGPRAVGVSTTGAVVGSIVASIAIDGVFAILFFRLAV